MSQSSLLYLFYPCLYVILPFVDDKSILSDLNLLEGMFVLIFYWAYLRLNLPTQSRWVLFSEIKLDSSCMMLIKAELLSVEYVENDLA